mgnify:CR=1 FL=1
MLKGTVTGTFLDNEPMTKHTSYGIGGPARAYITPADLEDLAAILRFAQENNISTFFAGSGSNLLVADEGFDGIVISLGKSFTRLSIEGNRIEAEVGESDEVISAGVFQVDPNRGTSAGRPVAERAQAHIAYRFVYRACATGLGPIA